MDAPHKLKGRVFLVVLHLNPIFFSSYMQEIMHCKETCPDIEINSSLVEMQLLRLFFIDFFLYRFQQNLWLKMAVSGLTFYYNNSIVCGYDKYIDDSIIITLLIHTICIFHVFPKNTA